MTGIAKTPLEAARTRIGAEVRSLLSGQVSPPVERFARRGGDEGLFGPDSVTWTVHGDAAMIVGGIRALLLQTLHPLAMAAIADHSNYQADPFGRLHRTGAFLAATTYGTTHTAEKAITAVRGIHARVSGVAPDGRPYTATDPHLITWVHVTEVDSFLAAYRRYGAGRLEPGDGDRYVAEMARIAGRLGAEEIPKSVAELDAWLTGVRPELAAGRQAREAVRFLLAPPMPVVARGAYAVIAAAAVGLLPRWARRLLWLPTAPGADALLVRPAGVALLRGLDWVLRPSSNGDGRREGASTSRARGPDSR